MISNSSIRPKYNVHGVKLIGHLLKWLLPLAGIFLYLACASLSSMSGYFQTISYLKIINFTVFILGLYVGVKNIHLRSREVYKLRTVFLAMACVLVFGSLFVLVVAPGIAYSTSVKGLMIIAEKRICYLHVSLLASILPLMYMTRSRTAFLALIVIVFMVYIYAMPKVKIPNQLKMKINLGMYTALGLLMLVMLVMEVRNNSISRLVRKTDDVSADDRGFTEALAASRMQKIDMLMNDFKKNPLLGMGFQVVEEHKYCTKWGRLPCFLPRLRKACCL